MFLVDIREFRVTYCCMVGHTGLMIFAGSSLIVGLRFMAIIERFGPTAYMIMIELSSEVGIPEGKLINSKTMRNDN